MNQWKSRENFCIFQVGEPELKTHSKLARQVFCSRSLSCSCSRLTVDTLGPYAKSKIVQPEQEAQSRDQPVIDKGMDYYFGCQIILGSVAQLVERALRMREAPGSKPGVSTLFLSRQQKVSALIFCIIFAAIERKAHKQNCPPDVGVEPTTTRLRALRSAN